jgi:poly(A) polymerase
MASHGDLQTYEWCREVLEEISQEEMRPPPLLTGHDLIDMGFRPGPIFSEILEAVEEAQLDGDIATTEEARKWVMEHYAPEA